MVKNYSEWNKSDIIGEPNHYYGISPKKTINISESWNILNESSSNLNRLDEHGFTASISRDEFINEAFPEINESANEYTKDKIYALYETQLFYTHREDLFNKPSKNNQTPLILESATTVIGDVPKKFDTVLKSIDKNGGEFDLEEVEIAETEKVEEPEKMVKLKKEDIEAIKSNKKEILALKESKCVDFNTWSKLSY